VAFRTKTIFVVRNAETAGQGAYDSLTATGFAQASRLAVLLAREKIDRIVSSPYLRAIQTAEPLAQTPGLKIEMDDRLVERVLCGEPRSDWRELLESSFDDLDARLPGGDSSRDAMNRARDVIRDALDNAADTTSLITHGCLLTLLLKSLDERFGFANWQVLAYPDVFRVTFSDDPLVIQRLDWADALA
jgi:2,3-bisphosphoglycerate-dependent phosphoglycerate mutase